MDRFQSELLAQLKEHNRLTKELVKIEQANFELTKDINKTNSSLAETLSAYELECLRAYRDIVDSGDCNVCRNGACEWKPELGHLVRYNCPHYVGIADGGEENA